VTAAMGLLATDMVYEYVATSYQRLSALDTAELEKRFAELEGEARRQLEEDGIGADRLLIQRVVDARYAGQGYELRVDVGSGTIDEAWAEKLRADFHDIHEREYSRRFEESDIEVPNIRVRGVGLMPPLEPTTADGGEETPPEDALRHEGLAWFRVQGSLQEVMTRYYDRPSLKAGNRLQGPSIVHQYDSTTVIPPGLTASIDGYGNIVIATGGAARAEALEAAEALEV
jgi:N-methylhydantoinase A/oxoprolinase/acetone carboxylase beta subunit